MLKKRQGNILETENVEYRTKFTFIQQLLRLTLGVSQRSESSRTPARPRSPPPPIPTRGIEILYLLFKIY